jgi:hypothetical protein
MKEDKYQSSVYCHCDNISTEVDLYGTFSQSSGVCTSCGTIFTSNQVPIGGGNTRNEYAETKSIKKILYEAISLFM